MSKHAHFCSCLRCFIREIGSLFGGAFLIMIVLFYGSLAVVAHVGFPALVAEIEQVRTDLVDVPPGDRAELINTAVKWNQRIAGCRYWNTVWFADPLYADGCDQLELLDVSP